MFSVVRCVLLLVFFVAFSSSSEDGEDKLPEFLDGVSVKVLYRTESCERLAEDGKWLELEYVATQKNDDGEEEEIDSTAKKNRPFLMEVGARVHHAGLTEGLRDVCVGDKREITVQPGFDLLEVHPKSDLLQPNMDREVVYTVTVRSIQDAKPPNLFNLIDANDDEQLTRDEVYDFIKEKGIGENRDNTAEEVVAEIMKSHDLNNDGILSPNEFPRSPRHSEL